MNVKDGGPAFPARPTEQLAGGISITTHHGMSLRDYFAAKALVAIMCAPNGFSINNVKKPVVEDFEAAAAAYVIADAMLKAREAT